MNKLVKFELNKEGYDYVCPDIHGDFPSLIETLIELGFDFEKDRLFCLGDLVNRGLYSEQVIKYIGSPWFYSVRGNHEELFIKAYEDLEGSQISLDGDASKLKSLHNLISAGGYWALPIMMKKRLFKKYYTSLSSLPLMIEIYNNENSVALVHAELPMGMKLKKAEKILFDVSHKKHKNLEDDLIGGRKVFNKFRKSSKTNEEDYVIPDILALFSGHTFINQSKPLKIANRFYLENKAWDFSRGHKYNILNLNHFFDDFKK